MKIEVVKVGDLECNCYLLEKDGKILVIDPGDDVDKIVNKINDREVVGIIITHYHFDHIGALDDVEDKYNVPICDVNNLEEKEYNINGFVFDVIYTKGHHDTCITIYFKDEKIMFTGDFIFKESIGRIDLGGNEIDMNGSLEKIKKYPKDITIYPGHGLSTTLEYELLNNIYLRKV